MDKDREGEIRSKLMSELDWPVTSGEVVAAAEACGEPDVASAARRLPDDGSWLEIDPLWEDLEPLLDDLLSA